MPSIRLIALSFALTLALPQPPPGVEEAQKSSVKEVETRRELWGGRRSPPPPPGHAIPPWYRRHPPPAPPPSPSPGPPGSGTCVNTCVYKDDGDCDDGGVGAEYALCDPCTDCDDCGPRAHCNFFASPPPPMPPCTVWASVCARTQLPCL